MSYWSSNLTTDEKLPERQFIFSFSTPHNATRADFFPGTFRLISGSQAGCSVWRTIYLVIICPFGGHPTSDNSEAGITKIKSTTKAVLVNNGDYFDICVASIQNPYVCIIVHKRWSNNWDPMANIRKLDHRWFRKWLVAYSAFFEPMLTICQFNP